MSSIRWPWARKPDDVGDQKPAALEPATRRVFGVNIDTGVLYGITPDDPSGFQVLYAPDVPRDVALSVPAVIRAREIIAGGIGQLPLRLLDSDNQTRDAWSWVTTQITPGKAQSVAIADLVEDLMFYRAGWLLQDGGTLGRGHQYQRLEPPTVTVVPQMVTTAYGTYERWPEHPGLIRVDSPTKPILKYGARAIAALAFLDQAASNAAQGVPPVDWFETTDGYSLDDTEGSGEDPEHPEWSELEVFLNGWREARQTRSTAYVPPGLAYKSNGFNPEQLQLSNARTHAVSEIARLTGIDAENLSIAVTSRSYFNAQDRERHLARRVLGPYLRAIELRLSMDDVTPRGYRVAFDLSELLQPDDLQAAQVDKTLIEVGVLTPNEVRARRGLQPLAGGDQAPDVEVVDAEIVDDPATGLGASAEIDTPNQMIKEISR